MSGDLLLKKCRDYLEKLCIEIPERCVGSEGNRLATRFFKDEIKSLGWDTETPEFDAIDWEDSGASLISGSNSFKIFPSPYSMGCDISTILVSASSIEDIKSIDANNKIVLLYGDIAREQLMPKNFIFYNPERHKNIISLLETCGAQAFICATGRNPDLAGGVYPFPLIEDGDFDIPSVYMTEEEGEKLLPFAGSLVHLISNSRRIPGKGYNVIASNGGDTNDRIVVTAHIDAKKGTPGAIDNATGVIILLLVARLLNDYTGGKKIELVAFNGEDYYAVSGQMDFVNTNMNHFDEILLNINIDGAGYNEGKSAYSLYGLPEEIEKMAKDIFSGYSGIEEGVKWPQGDHSIFIQFGCPAIAVSSKWFTDNISTQDITHTPRDKPSIVDCGKVVEIALALNDLIKCL